MSLSPRPKCGWSMVGASHMRMRRSPPPPRRMRHEIGLALGSGDAGGVEHLGGEWRADPERDHRLKEHAAADVPALDLVDQSSKRRLVHGALSSGLNAGGAGEEAGCCPYDRLTCNSAKPSPSQAAVAGSGVGLTARFAVRPLPSARDGGGQHPDHRIEMRAVRLKAHPEAADDGHHRVVEWLPRLR